MNREGYERDEYYDIQEKKHNEEVKWACILLGSILIGAVVIRVLQSIWGWLN